MKIFWIKGIYEETNLKKWWKTELVILTDDTQTYKRYTKNW